jgi:trehalose 2-sulfotransferase
MVVPGKHGRNNSLKPRLSYTVWFSQRTGSTLLCKALESTGIAGKPNEWLNMNNPIDLLEQYHLSNYAELQEHLWELGSTPNGVFGLKFSPHEPYLSELLEVFRRFPNYSQGDHPRATIWENAFPNSRHIFMTRRNKVRLAVSWWKAIKTQEWHREKGDPSQSVDLTDAYSFDAIKHLYCECTMREAGMQEFFSEAGIIPLTVVYEDFIQEYEKTIKRILDYLGLDTTTVAIAPPYYEQLSDHISEIWVQRFREEFQQGWTNRGW